MYAISLPETVEWLLRNSISFSHDYKLNSVGDKFLTKLNYVIHFSTFLKNVLIVYHLANVSTIIFILSICILFHSCY
jgi:hypothetical protein